MRLKPSIKDLCVMISTIMPSSAFLCVVLFFFTSKATLVYDGVVKYVGDQASDHQLKEPHIQQWITQPVSSPVCPQHCKCKMNDIHHIISVDCSSTGLTMVPDLPNTTVELSLRNNSISNITCASFKLLRSLQCLNLALNQIHHLPPCVFQSQSTSLLNLNISDNNIGHLDVQIFQNLSRLETLGLSRNLITELAPETFLNLANLIHLNLSFNYIQNIAYDAFKGLHSLKTLLLQNNRLDDDTSFHRDVFQDLGALETLDVKANQGVIDDAVSPLRNLSSLYMDVSSKYTTLGIGFRELVNLRSLHASTVVYAGKWRYKNTSTCIIPTVPSTFFENIRTEKDFEAYMSSCHITAIGQFTFSTLSTLVTLDLSFNPGLKFGTLIQSWMDGLINTSITFLDLSNTTSARYNDINDSCLKSLAKTNLKTLELRLNNIRMISANEYFPATIEKLVVSQNSLSLNMLYHFYVLPGFSNSKLRELHTNDQKLAITAQQISQDTSDTDTNHVGQFSPSYTHHKISDGAGSPVEQPELLENEVPNGIDQALKTSIGETINLGHASMAIPESRNVFSRTKCPEYLKSQDPENEIHVICLPSDLEAIYANSALRPIRKSIPYIRVLNNTVLRHVELADNLLTSWLGPVENVLSLKVLDLSRNQCCEKLDFAFFKYMVSLETLILKENLLGLALATDANGLTFSTLTKLKVLDLSQNFILFLSGKAFIHNTNLATLDLSDNRLSEFQPTLSTISNMSFLNLSLNFLPGLSEQTCEELKLLKSRNKNFTVNLLDNPLLFTCDYLPFLELIFLRSDIFFKAENLEFKHTNGTKFHYKDLAHHFALLAKGCVIQLYFDLILIIFFVVVGTVSIVAIVHYKRWKLRYLYYIGHRRMHIGEQIVDYAPVADVYITYDQDDLRWRRFMQQTFLPGLNQRNITYILGETDFPGGDLMAHVTGAVVGTRKMVVLLSLDIFDDLHREYEMNLAIMREIDTRSLKIVPILVEEVDLALNPREIELFLRNQWQRCLSYRNSDGFWDDFVEAVREDN